MREVRGLSPGKLGHGCNPSEVRDGISLKPNYLSVDAGSTDMGPYYLGAGAPFFHPLSVKKDLRILLEAASSANIPLIIGNAITAGTDRLLKMGFELLREVALEIGIHSRVAIVTAEPRREDVKRRIKTNQISPLGASSPLSEEDVDSAEVILAQMGIEPIMKALDTGANVVITGRACDDALFAAFPVREGFDKGLALHMGKILECGSMACVPGDLHGSLLGILRDDHFILEPPSLHRACTVRSVAAHTLYERSDPYVQPGPGGINDLRDCRFIQTDARRVTVSGSRWTEDQVYKIKLEGVRFAGYRTICISGIRDPLLIASLRDVLQTAETETNTRFANDKNSFRILFRQYGLNAVMGELEPMQSDIPHEIGLLIEVVAESQELADAVCMYIRGTIQHAYYPGIIATAGNLAYPFSPFTISCGPVYRFTIDHLMEVTDPTECFEVTTETVGVVAAGTRDLTVSKQI
jgi:hypothetical protein